MPSDRTSAPDSLACAASPTLLLSGIWSALERGADRGELVARGQDGDAWGAMHVELGVAAGRRHGECRRRRARAPIASSG